MSSLRRFLIRVTPIVGTFFLSAYAIAFTRYYVNERKNLGILMDDSDDPFVLEFYKETANSANKNGWENKRVYRPWESELESELDK